jgi:hypothetical protein
MATGETTARSRHFVLGIALFVLLGTPLVAYLWDTLNHLFSGIIEPLRLLIALPAALLFYVLLRFMARSVVSWQTERNTHSDSAA